MLGKVATSVLGTAALVFATSGTAQADVSNGADEGGGFSVGVTAVVGGSDGGLVTGGGGGSVSLPVPPKCWWEPMHANYDLSGDFDADDPEDFKAFYDEMISQMKGHAAAGYFAFPSEDYVKRIVKQEKSGEADFTWYTLGMQDGVNCVEEGFTSSRGTYGDAYGGQGAGDQANVPIAVSYQAFPAAQGPPPPLVDVGDLAEQVWARAAQNIEDPAVDRNPKIASTGNSTLVNLPTWFWVTNTAGALADDGKVHLTVSIPNTPVHMTLNAQTDGVTVTSPVGARECSIEQIKNSYAPGKNDDSACTVEFSKADRGWPVTTTTSWTGSWQGVDNNGPQSGTIEVVGHSTTVDVPVAESQSVVNDVG